MTTTRPAIHVAAPIDDVFRALASVHRREILRILSEASEAGKECCEPDEVCACKIAERLGLAPSTVSHHMTVLTDAGLVSARKDGHWVYYRLQRESLAAAAEELRAL